MAVNYVRAEPLIATHADATSLWHGFDELDYFFGVGSRRRVLVLGDGLGHFGIWTNSVSDLVNNVTQIGRKFSHELFKSFG